MSTENTLTDQFNLVQREEVKGLFRLFTRQKSVSDGFCLVVFRKEEYRGSILSDDVYTEGDLKRRSERLGVRDGDIILRINLGPRPLSISEKLGTMDGYTRPYTLELEIRVSDPRSFSQRYLQWSDPVKLARIAIEGYLQRYAIRKKHDELREDMLRDYAEQALRESTNRSFGIEVVAAHKATLYMDPIRSKELEILQQARLKEKEIREKSRIKRIETEEDADIRKTSVRGDAEVKKLETQYQQEMEAYLIEERSKQREVTRVEEFKEKEHQILLEGKQNRFLRLEAGRDSDAKREQEELDTEHQARQNRFKLEKANEQRKLTRVYEIEEQEHKEVYEIEEQERKLQLESRSLDHALHETFKKTVGVNTINAFSDRISQMLEDGASLDEVLRQNPQLRSIFQNPTRSDKQNVRQEPLRIEEATNHTPPASAANDRSNVTSTDATSQPVSARQETTPQPTPFRQEITPQPIPLRQETTSQPFTQMTGTLPGILRQPNDTIDITDLGMTLKKIELSAEQHAIAATHTPTAFSISVIDEHGPARKAQLTIGDIVIEINGEEPCDTQSILGILKSYKPGSSVPLCILRGEDLINVEV